ncbi:MULTISPECIES: phosphate/phosphite/phosphonate ABC transporter substrate-binding protein [Micrococcus]|uniref:phosphate/phosphite/phosphonate ABC transporter substrate-binding protein n=1 Tax=Micrococcus luteus TaxID=1270 RepID=UPI0019D1063C|nr:phosphate/phosphite/phosphonate ABC transporter substrate-binding protein [Micrococcus luteus]MBN6767534.1 phosphate/phosphite/phosphonate ABC transporter substrate-binding protein [Micrococcus luteus]MBN6827907.1 phosphate/phosphite/phosphonate ABC transporter substrate-binding protein [Micrococcus luteus]MBN6846651.1 phosphate/phosphite/phosphonate ABC transporter substrate-binding protein [Micrococcus luteus]MBN6862754.1 phosphate/phosphite/phosphonate ABC transporter substrate-binding pr
MLGRPRLTAAATAALTASALLLSGCTAASESEASAAPETLRVALLPDENASEVIKNNEPLKSYLEEQLGLEVELVVTTDYSSMIEAMAGGRLELGYFGPLSYVLAQEKADIEPFAALQEVEGEDPTYQSVFIANSESGIESLDDVAGKTVAWGDQASTSSHLIPKAMLAEGADLRVDHGDYEEQYVGSHDAVALAVQNGNADAGGMSLPIYERMVEEGLIDPTTVVKVQESEPYANYPWTMQSDLPEDLKEKLRRTFLDLEDPAVLEPFDAAGFEEVTDADYDAVRELAPLLDIDLEDYQ